MSYILSKETEVWLVEDITREQLQEAKEGTIRIFNTQNHSWYDSFSQTWETMKVRGAKPKDLVKPTLDDKDFRSIKLLADQQIGYGKIPLVAKEFLSMYFFFSALEWYLTSKGSDPGFKMDIDTQTRG